MGPLYMPESTPSSRQRTLELHRPIGRTLALGLVLNLFTAVIVTRTFLAYIMHATGEQIARRRWLLGA